VRAVTNLAVKITELWVIYLPAAVLLAGGGFGGVATAYLFKVRIPRHRWITVFARVIAGGLTLLLLVAFGFALLMLWVTGGGPRTRAYVSPDSKHIAYYWYTEGWLGRDTADVYVGGIWHRPGWAYSHGGGSDFADTDVIWLSNDDLLVRYSVQEDGPQYCNSPAAGIRVRCVPRE
jgi:hypothetical protein